MSLWHQITHGLRALTNRAKSDRELDDEAQHFLDQATEEFIVRGLSPEDARREARLEFGNAARIREQVRDYGWENSLETFIADIRYAARRLRATPGFTLVTVFILAFGIGATTAIFSAVHPILIEPLPYPDASRIATISGMRQDGGRGATAFGTYREILQRTRVFESIAAIRSWQPTLTSDAEPERLQGQMVGAAYFRTLGVSPVLGRDFRDDEDRRNGPSVVILSDALWRRRFAASPSILGAPITLNGVIGSVIGVMPPGFENVAAPDAEFWSPLQYDMSDGRAWGHHLKLLARLRADVSIDQASRELNTLWPALLKEHPKDLFHRGLLVSSLQDDVTSAIRPALLVVMGAVVLMLLVACVNVTNLQVARGARRQGEFAVRTALGAGRGRIIRQLLTENVLLAVIGGGLGIILAEAGIRVLTVLSPADLPRIGRIGMNGSVLWFSIGVTSLAGLAFGLFPAIQASRRGVQAGLQQDSRRTSGRHRVTRSALVVAEVALALVLLVSAGLLLRSMQRLLGVSPGFRPAQLLTMQVQVSRSPRVSKLEDVYRFFENALEAARQVPGVRSAAFTNQLPMSGDQDLYGVRLEKEPGQDPRQTQEAFRYAVTPKYFETVGIPLIRGRLLEETDRAGAPLSAVISESLANRRFAGMDPIGQRMQIGPLDAPLYTIVGVVGDVKQMSLMRSEADAIYVTPTQWRFADMVLTLVVRAESNAEVLAPALRRGIWSVDKDQAIVRVATMEELLALSSAERRFVMILVTAFAAAALILAAAGIYGILSGSVAERVREIGIRSALGASQRDIVALIVRQGLTLTVCGAAVGLIAAAAASGMLVSLLFGVSRLDFATYAGTIALLVLVSAAACWVPAWRASRVDPAITLRAE